jgi:hypothetical protein
LTRLQTTRTIVTLRRPRAEKALFQQIHSAEFRPARAAITGSYILNHEKGRVHMRSIATVGQHQDRKTNRNRVAKAARQSVEQLEGRRMMAADPFDFRNTPVFTSSTADLRNIKDGPLAKGGQALVDIYSAYVSFVKKGGNRYAFSQKSAYAVDYNIKGRDLLLTLRTRGSVTDLAADLKSLGSTIVTKSKSSRIIEAFVPLNQIENLAARKEIMHARPQLRPIVDSQGAVGNDAERSQKTEFVLPAFGVDGSGQTVGVISDSFGSQTQSIFTGDLPANGANVIQDDFGTDEGRAMAELIYDLAPGVDLAFSAAGATVNTFAKSIRDLREAGATVIVDDIRMADEPFFGEGVIDRAVNDVRDDGAVYLSSQGNYGFAGYSAGTHWVTDPSGDGLANDFDPSDRVDTDLDLHFNHAGIVNFQWDNAYDGAVANVDSDVDVYLYRNGTLISKSVDDNFATGVPIERLDIPEGGDYEMVIRIASSEKNATLPTMFKFAQRDSTLLDSRTDVEYPGYNSSTWGHSAASGNIPVAAVDNASSNAFGTARNLVSQDFSSGGPSVRVFDPNGNRLPESLVIQTPLISGIQGTNTSVPGFAPFFGTSASAPNIAAVAALLRELAPDATPEDIKDALVESAKTQPLNGAQAGEYDNQAGYGLVDAIKAASVFSPETPVSTFNVASTNNNGSVNSIAVTFTEPVTGVDISDFILNRDGTSVNRFTGSEGLEASLDGMTYTITNLKSATSILGVYTIILRNNRTDILDDESNVAAGNIVSFDVSLRKVSGLLADTLDDGKIRLRWNDSNGAEDSYRIQRATDSFFSENVRNIDVGADETTYVDNDVLPGVQYFYRVRASKGGRLGDAAKVNIVSSSAGEIFVDDRLAKLVGNWSSDTDADAFLQTDAAASATDASGANANVATFSSNDIANGNYFVYVRYTEDAGNATNATFQVMLDKKVIDAVQVDQTKRGGGWVVLGKYRSTGVGALSVRLNSAGASGPVNVDAVRFLPADEGTVVSFQTLQRKRRKAAEAAAELTA